MKVETASEGKAGWMNEELEMFRAAIDRFIQRECLPYADDWERAGEVPREVWRKAGAAGLLMASAPAEYGGGGGSFAHEAVIIEAFNGSGAEGILVGMQSCLFGAYLLEFGSEDQKRAWVPKLASGEWLSAVALSEPGTGSDLKGIATRAVRDGDDYLISGQKTFITLGLQADIIMVAARTGEGENGAVSLFFVEADSPGFSRGRRLEKIGRHSHGTAELFFDNVRVPAANLIGGVEGQGMRQLMFNLAQERLGIALEGVATMDRAIDETLAYVRERKAFGKPIMDFQNTQFVLAECKTETVIARVFLNQCVADHIERRLSPTVAAMAKLWVSEAQGRVIDRCLQLFGGYGYIEEYPIARLYRNARVSRIYGGSSEIMKLIIARSL